MDHEEIKAAAESELPHPEESEKVAEPVKTPEPVKTLSRAAKITSEIGNEFFVSTNMQGIIVQGTPRGLISYERALVFAAWLVALSEGRTDVEFKDVLDAVQNT